jgi:putative MATE family efflux protein
MLALALPVMAEELANLLVGYTDWYLAGRYLAGDAPKAAMSLVAYSLWLLPTIFAAVAIGSQAIVARLVGSGDRAAASLAANQSLLLGVVLASIGTVVVWFGAGTFVELMQLQGKSAELAQRFLRIMAPVVPLIMLEQVAAACLRGAGDTWTGFLAKATVNLLNIVFSTGLVTGWGPFPELGWEGLAVGTAIGHGGGGLILVVCLLRGRAGLQLSWRSLRPDRELLRRILRIGLPGGLDQLGVLGCHLVYASIINRLGTQATAAHGMGIQIEALSFLPGSAFMVAAATLAGQSLGATDPRAATRGILHSWIAAASIMGLAGIVFYFFGGRLAEFFNGGQPSDVTRQVGELLRIIAVGTVFHGTLMVLTGGLRGAGDTRWPLLITLLGLGCIRLPLAAWLAWSEVPLGPLVLPGLGWGVQGAWIAMVSDIIVRTVLVVLRFLHGGWRHVAV